MAVYQPCCERSEPKEHPLADSNSRVRKKWFFTEKWGIDRKKVDKKSIIWVYASVGYCALMVLQNRNLKLYGNGKNVLKVENRIEFRQWLALHSLEENECWIKVKRGRPINPDVFYYLDAVEEALCFGWIDSTHAVIVIGEWLLSLCCNRRIQNAESCRRQIVRYHLPFDQ